MSIEADSPPSYVVSASQVLEFILYKLVISIVPKITTSYKRTWKLNLKVKIAARKDLKSCNFPGFFDKNMGLGRRFLLANSRTMRWANVHGNQPKPPSRTPREYFSLRGHGGEIVFG